MSKITESYQVPSGNVSPDIFALPCVHSVTKKGGIEYGVFVNGKVEYPNMAHAHPSDWICKRENGTWVVLANEEYQAEKGGGE